MKKIFSNFFSHIEDSEWAENVFLSIVQTKTEVLNKSHFSLQMGNCPIPVVEHSGPCRQLHTGYAQLFVSLLRTQYPEFAYLWPRVGIFKFQPKFSPPTSLVYM